MSQPVRPSFAALESLELRLLMSHSRVPFVGQTNLISDQAGQAQVTNANLVNAWGIAFGGSSPFWINANGSGTSLVAKISGGVLDTSGAGPQTITIPTAANNADGANPTGAVFNSTGSFVVTNNGSTGPAAYLFASEDGSISAWRPTGANTSPAVRVVDNGAAGAVYKGLAIGKLKNTQGQDLLYAADFHNNRIDVFDGSFHAVTTLGANAFKDPNMAAGYAPFNVANIGGQLYVTYALQDAAKHDDVAGPRHGFVDVFNGDGTFVKRFAGKGTLDSPWAVVQAPKTFGQFAGDILVGNFGNGQISAFKSDGTFQGLLPNSRGKPVTIQGLWGLSFGSGVNAGNANTLYFTAGPADESHGLFGALDLVLRKA